jgi:hypothetical protein
MVTRDIPFDRSAAVGRVRVRLQIVRRAMRTLLVAAAPVRPGPLRPAIAGHAGHEHAARLDSVAGSEFVDDRLRLRE